MQRVLQLGIDADFGIMLRDPVAVAISMINHGVHGKRLGNFEEGIDLLKLGLASRGNNSYDSFNRPLIGKLHNPYGAQQHMLGLDVGTAIAHLKELDFVGVNEAYVESKYLLLEVFGVLDDIRPATLQIQFAEDCKDFLAIQKCQDRGDCSEARNRLPKGHMHHMNSKDLTQTTLSLADYKILKTVANHDTRLYTVGCTLFFKRLNELEIKRGTTFRCSQIAKDFLRR